MFLIVLLTVHQFRPHNSEGPTLFGFSESVCPHHVGRAVYHFDLSRVDLILDEEELCLHVFRFLQAGEPPVGFQELGAHVVLVYLCKFEAVSLRSNEIQRPKYFRHVGVHQDQLGFRQASSV